MVCWDWVHAQVAQGLTFCERVRYVSTSVHAPRRPQHIMPSGAGSSGAAVLMAMITSEMEGIEERAVLGSAAHRSRCSTGEATRWRE